MEIIKEILMAFILAGICTTCAYVLSIKKQFILSKITELIQAVETAIDGSGLGETKKELVINQLEAAGIKIKKWIPLAIDNIVETLNDKSAWLSTSAISEVLSTEETSESEDD